LHDWVTEALRPQSTISKREFPAGLVDDTIDTYVKELLQSNKRTLELYSAVKSLIRHNW
jgi:nuclear pore complex protein Nup155